MISYHPPIKQLLSLAALLAGLCGATHAMVDGAAELAALLQDPLANLKEALDGTVTVPDHKELRTGMFDPNFF
jgi:hypothetical protein